MARGYRDFHGAVIHPQGGVTQSQNLAALSPIGAGAVVDLVTVANRGSSYGGWIWFDCTALPATVLYLDFVIDGVSNYTEFGEVEMDFGFHRIPDQFANLVCWDLEDHKVAWTIGKDWTWDLTCIIRFENLTGGAVACGGRFYWSMISGA